MSAGRVAAIDIGTVTARLLVADLAGGVVTEVARRAVITQLGEGWTATGRLSDAAIARVVRAVAGFRAEADSLGVTRLAAVATSAARDASNTAELLERLAGVGVTPEVITGEGEARLTFTGATYGRTGDGLLVVDVGGGSTELVAGSAANEEEDRSDPAARPGGVFAPLVRAARSVDVGSRRITERFLHGDPPSARELKQARAWVTAALEPFFSGLASRPREMIATAGVATSLAAIEQALDPYDPARVHGFRLSAHALEDCLGRLAALPLEGRRRVVGLEPERAVVIVGGALVLAVALSLSGLTSTLVSEHDILYGMVLDLHAPEAGIS